MQAEPTRRRVLSIMAAAAATGFVPPAGARTREWRGAALGADVSIRFSDADGVLAEQAVARILDEVERLEAIFSLQRGDSELSRLNATGRLEAPSPDLVHVLSIARQAHGATFGRFDPTVQPLWRFHFDWYAADPSRPRPHDADLEAVRTRVGLSRVGVGPDLIELPPGGAVTLNGVAQGHITDRAVALLRADGFRRVLVDLGETRALEGRPDGDPWRIALPDARRISLTDGAIATSAGAATRFAANGDHHIFDPVTGRPARHWDWLAVAHPSAIMADALSTGLYCLEPRLAAQAIRAVPDARMWARGNDGAQIEA